MFHGNNSMGQRLLTSFRAIFYSSHLEAPTQNIEASIFFVFKINNQEVGLAHKKIVGKSRLDIIPRIPPAPIKKPMKMSESQTGAGNLKSLKT